MTTRVVNVNGMPLEEYTYGDLYTSYQKVVDESNKAGDTHLNDGVNPMPVPLFTFEVRV